MTLQFIDGFDHLATADLAMKWDTVSGITISSTQTRGAGGGGAAVATSDTHYLRKMGLAPHSTYVIGASFYVTQLPLDWQLCTFWETTAQAQLCVRLTNTGAITVYRGNEAVSLGSTGVVMASLNVWHVMQCKLVVSSTVGSVSIRIDGLQVVNFTGVNTQGGATTNVNGVGIGSPFPGAGTFSALYTDDFYALNGAGTINNDFISHSRVATLRPNATGNYSQFTPTGSTPNYACVAEATQDGDTTYVSGTPGQIDSYLLSSLPASIPSVAGVQTNSIARFDDTNATAIGPLQRSGGVDGLGTWSDLTSSYTDARSIYNTSIVTGLPWTPGEVNASEFGVEVRVTGASASASVAMSARVMAAAMSATATLLATGTGS